MLETSASQTVGVIVFVLRGTASDRELLFLRRSGGDYATQWWPVGGTCKTGELPIQTVFREVLEETGLEPSALYSFGLDIAHVDGRSRIEAFVAFVDPTAMVKLNSEHSEYKWLSVNEAAKLVADPAPILWLDEKFMRTEPEGVALFHRV